MSRFITTGLAAALLAIGTFASGCLFSSSSRTYQSGAYVSESTLAQIEPGKTTEEFVLATLGPPTSRTTLSDGLDLWKWRYTRRRTSSGTVFLVLASSNREETKSTTHIAFRDGIVERVWQD